MKSLPSPDIKKINLIFNDDEKVLFSEPKILRQNKMAVRSFVGQCRGKLSNVGLILAMTKRVKQRALNKIISGRKM